MCLLVSVISTAHEIFKRPQWSKLECPFCHIDGNLKKLAAMVLSQYPVCHGLIRATEKDNRCVRCKRLTRILSLSA